jgi:hypothetical protein
VEAYAEIAIGVLDLAPCTEPPLGFDRSAVAWVTSRPRRTRTVAISVVAAVIAHVLVVAGAVHVVGGSHRRVNAGGVVAVFREGGVPVGSFSAGGQSPAGVGGGRRHVDFGAGHLAAGRPQRFGAYAGPV